MRQAQTNIQVSTNGQGLVDVTNQISSWAVEQGISDGLLTVFIRHTSASLVIQENADPNVLTDLQTFFRKVAKEDPSLYRHTEEGPDDMPAHIKCALTQTHLSIPMTDRRLGLGTWQGVYLFEHRSRPHNRTLMLHLSGTP